MYMYKIASPVAVAGIFLGFVAISSYFILDFLWTCREIIFNRTPLVCVSVCVLLNPLFRICLFAVIVFIIIVIIIVISVSLVMPCPPLFFSISIIWFQLSSFRLLQLSHLILESYLGAIEALSFSYFITIFSLYAVKPFSFTGIK